MVRTKGELIDVCVDYINHKDAAYIAMTGEVVFQHKGQYSWHKQTIAQTLRVIKATKLDPDSYDLLQERHLIAAFQELAKVFESATDTKGDAPVGVFNYRAEGNCSLEDFLLEEFVAALTRDYLCVQHRCVVACYLKFVQLLGETCDVHGLEYEMFVNDWQKKSGSTRIKVNGGKGTAWMRTGAKPSDIKIITDGWLQLLIARTRGKMK